MTNAPASGTAPRAKRRIIVIPIVLFLMLFIAYSFVWAYGSKIMEREVTAFIDAERAMGRTISYESRKIKGYPFSLRTQIDGFTWADPGEWSWSGDRLYVITLPYDVSRIILAPRGDQEIALKGRQYQATAKAINVGLKQGAYNAEADELTISAKDGSKATTGRLRANWVAAEGGGWKVTAAVRQATVTHPGTPSFEVPFASVAAEQTPATNGQLNIELAELVVTKGAGVLPTQLSVSGQLGSDRNGHPIGSLAVSIRNEKTALDIAEESGLLTPTVRTSAEAGLGAFTNNGSQEANFTFNFRDQGMYYFGQRIGNTSPLPFRLSY